MTKRIRILLIISLYVFIIFVSSKAFYSYGCFLRWTDENLALTSIYFFIHSWSVIPHTGWFERLLFAKHCIRPQINRVRRLWVHRPPSLAGEGNRGAGNCSSRGWALWREPVQWPPNQSGQGRLHSGGDPAAMQGVGSSWRPGTARFAKGTDAVHSGSSGRVAQGSGGQGPDAGGLSCLTCRARNSGFESVSGFLLSSYKATY